MKSLGHGEPWEKIDWNPETLQNLYRDWGVYYTHKQQLKIAKKYYSKALEIKEDDPKALVQLSKCKRESAMAQSALEDATKAAQYDDRSAPIDLEICDGMYEMNDFESCKVELHNKSRKYSGTKVQSFYDRLDVIDENFKDSVGDNLDAFLRKNEKHLTGIMDELISQRKPDPRPLWKILQELRKCDVLSQLEIEEIRLSPREIAQRQRNFKILNQIYFNTSWVDVLFIKMLRQDPNLMLSQSYYSTPILKHYTENTYDTVRRFLKMLHCRSPLYNELALKFPNKRIREEHRNAHLNRVQYQTRRNMNSILKTVRLLRQTGSAEKLAKYVEEIMGDYVVLKTHRIMPWKFEFVHEIYNILALAYVESYAIPDDLAKQQPEEHLRILLKLPLDKSKDHKEFVFGDRSTYQELDLIDRQNAIYKRFIARLEKRLRFATHNIERSYLFHEIARVHLAHSRFDECSAAARKGVTEAQNCSSNAWEFLCKLLILKSLSVLHKVERAKDILADIRKVARHLKSPRITDFIELCNSINEYEITLKKRTYSNQSMQKRRSRISMGSRITHSSSQESRHSINSQRESKSFYTTDLTKP